MLQNNPHADAWRQTHLGQLLGHALRQFDQRVRTLMVQDAAVPLALSNLAERDKVSAAHLHITRHLSPQGDRLTDLADRAGMSKQAMADLIDQCEAWGLVRAPPRPAGPPRQAGALHRQRPAAAPGLCPRHGPGRGRIYRRRGRGSGHRGAHCPGDVRGRCGAAGLSAGAGWVVCIAVCADFYCLSKRFVFEIVYLPAQAALFI